MSRIVSSVAAAAAVVAGVAGCGGGHAARRVAGVRTGTATAAAPAPKPAAPPYPVALRGARDEGTIGWTPAISVAGHVAAWVKRTGQITLARFDQSYLTLALHAGAVEPGGSGWRYGAAVGARERGSLVAAFNGGFRLNTDTGGFVEDHRVGKPLLFGDASAVTYSDGTTDIGAWRQGVPAPGRRVESVRQTLHLLVDHGRPSPDIDCGPACWGFPLHGAESVARSALAVTSTGRLVWAGGEHLTVAELADALAGAGAVRAMELDINPDWVHGFLYAHPGLTALPLVPEQTGGPDLYLTPANRDFFTILART